MNEIFAFARASPIPPMLGFVAGIVAAQQLPALPPLWLMACLFGVALALLPLRALRIPVLFLLGLC